MSVWDENRSEKISESGEDEKRDQTQSLVQCDSGLSQAPRSVDELYKALGRPGRYTIVMICLLTSNMLTIAPNHAAGAFIGHSPNHECRPFPENITHGVCTTSQSSVNESYSATECSNVSLELNGTSTEEVAVLYFKCKAVWKMGGNITDQRQCTRHQWRYDVADHETSSVTEWDLVCESAYLANLASTFYFIGVMVGGISFGYVSDRFGRKVALLISVYMSVSVGLAIVFTTDLMAFFVLRTLMGVAIQGLQTSTYICLVEMLIPELRNFAVTVHCVFWSGSFVVLGLIAWSIRNWRYMQLAIIVQAALALFFTWLIPESVRWLIAQRKLHKASQIVQRICRFNGSPPDLHQHIGSLMTHSPDGMMEKKKHSISYLDLVRTSQMRRRTILMCYTAFATNIGYWGLTYNTIGLVGNKYLNFTLGSVAETAMSVINVFIVKRFGKKRALIVYYVIGGFCCITMSCVVTESSPFVANFVLVISTLGRLTTGGLFVANDLYMAELFPTVIRNMGIGVCTFMGRLGAVFTPLIFTLGTYTFQQFPLLIFGLVTFAGGLLTVLLPETSQMELPETLEDVISAKDNIKKNGELSMVVELVDSSICEEHSRFNQER